MRRRYQRERSALLHHAWATLVEVQVLHACVNDEAWEEMIDGPLGHRCDAIIAALKREFGTV